MDITRDELRRIIERDEDVLTINVLGHDRYLDRHIPGSISIPLQEPGFVKRVEDQVTRKDERVIVYCASRSCDASRQAAKALQDAGFTNVTAYEGGMAEWEEAGLPTVAGAAAL